MNLDIVLLAITLAVMIFGFGGYLFSSSKEAKTDLKNAIEVSGYAVVALILMIWPLCFYYAPVATKIIAAALLCASLAPMVFAGNAMNGGGFGLGLLILLPSLYIGSHAVFMFLKQ